MRGINEEEREILKIMQRGLKILKETDNKLWGLFEDFGYDPAYFDVEIDLKFKVGEKEVRIRWKEKAIPP